MTKTTSFKAGDTVILKVGGPRMIVNGDEVIGNQILCVWFSGKKREQGYYPLEGLELAPPEDKP